MKQKKYILKLLLALGLAITILFGLTSNVASNSETTTREDYPSSIQAYVSQINTMPKPKRGKYEVSYEQINSTPTGEIQEYAYKRVCEIWGCEQFVYLKNLWNHESGWQPGRLNKSSLACGIPQALPCTKIYPNFLNMERVWYNGKLYIKNPNWIREVDWGLQYIISRPDYSNPQDAWYLWNSRDPHWY